MINDPALMALIQARRQYNARDPGSIITRGPDPVGPPIPVDPPPVAPPQPSAADRAVNRGALMQNYMRTMGLTPMRYGQGDVRTGNMSLGSDNAGVKPAGSQVFPAAPPPVSTAPVGTGDGPVKPPYVPRGPNAPPPGYVPPPADVGGKDPAEVDPYAKRGNTRRFGAI